MLGHRSSNAYQIYIWIPISAVVQVSNQLLKQVRLLLEGIRCLEIWHVGCGHSAMCLFSLSWSTQRSLQPGWEGGMAELQAVPAVWAVLHRGAEVTG